MNYKNIKYAEQNKVATIQLHRPKFLNALCDELIEELSNALDYANSNNDIHVVILKGSEKAFAAGADISEMKNLTLLSHIKEEAENNGLNKAKLVEVVM